MGNSPRSKDLKAAQSPKLASACTMARASYRTKVAVAKKHTTYPNPNERNRHEQTNSVGVIHPFRSAWFGIDGLHWLLGSAKNTSGIHQFAQEDNLEQRPPTAFHTTRNHRNTQRTPKASRRPASGRSLSSKSRLS